MIHIVEYQTDADHSPFGEWFAGLDAGAAAIITVALARLADGNTSRVAPIGEGAAEIRIDRGLGYRVYFGWDGTTLVILLGGGSKRRQQKDIQAALARWRDYKARKTRKT